MKAAAPLLLLRMNHDENLLQKYHRPHYENITRVYPPSPTKRGDIVGRRTEMTVVQSFFGKDWKNVLSFDKVIDDGISMDDGGEDGVLVGDGKIQEQ